MALPRTDDTDGLVVADVMHDEVGALSADATVAEARLWFAPSVSRRLAIVADGDRYVGVVTPADLVTDLPADRPLASVARAGDSVAPDVPAATGLEIVLASATRRVPVVDGDGRLHGVLAITADGQHFACRDRARPG
ncbi:MAG TPA: CBS domain-containing protein [Solirubrobacteraceae bacterium]|jgi:CBS domain-containing protein|nr:CBS domain-containing protein [Solirubrobacteraceae bacterium]